MDQFLTASDNWLQVDVPSDVLAIWRDIVAQEIATDGFNRFGRAFAFDRGRRLMTASCPQSHAHKA